MSAHWIPDSRRHAALASLEHYRHDGWAALGGGVPLCQRKRNLMSIRVWGGLAADKRDKTRGKQPQRDVFHRLNYQENTIVLRTT